MSKSRNKKIAKELIRMRNKLTKRQQKEYAKVFNQLQSYVITPSVGVGFRTVSFQKVVKRLS